MNGLTRSTSRCVSWGSPYNQDINMQHMCALMLVDGYASFEATHDMSRMKDPRVLALRKREILAERRIIEAVLRGDPSLAFRLMRFINSPVRGLVSQS